MAIVSRNYLGDPEFGPDIYIEKSNTTKPRVLLGWIHNEDTPQGLKDGKLWCWVSEHDRFYVFDENFNRSKIPGEVRDCGVANFTMVRMFHPYWLKNGQVPRDMVWPDKRECREKYRALLSRRPPNLSSNDSDDEDDSDADDPPPPPQPSLPSSTGPNINEGKRPTLMGSSNARRGRRDPSTGVTKERPYFINDTDSDSDSDSEIVGNKPFKVESKNSHTMERLLAGITGHNAGFRNTHTTGPIKNENVYDLTNSRPSSLLRSSVTRENRTFKRSPGPAFSTELLRNLSGLNRTEQDPTSSNLQSDETTCINNNIGRGDFPILPTIEIDEMDVKQEEETIPVRHRNRPATVKPPVIVLDDLD